MNKSKYAYFFEIDSEYVGYSYLSDNFVSFPIEKKKRVEEIIKYPDDIVTNADVVVYKELCDNKCLIGDDFDEYNHLIRLHRQFINRTDCMMLTIMPTMNCNCRCPYCYELHTNSKISHEVIDNLKKYIDYNIKELHYFSISWFGGEPLLCMNIIKEVSEFCIDLCSRKNVVFINSMTTNGVLLNKKNSQILSECKINSVQITLDGSKNNHDQTRVTVSGKPTFDIIHNNIIDYLNADENNKVTLRIHVSAHEGKNNITGTIETLKLFDQKYRKRIRAYPHFLFSACSEKFSNESCESCNSNSVNSRDEDAADITNKIYKEIVKLGYKFGYNLGRGVMTACPFEAINNWAVRPDGYLTKCTVGIEKERALAKLTKDGIKILPERFAKTYKKEFSSELYDYCKDCKYLPFCWQKCTYNHYQNPSWNKNAQILGCKNKASWMIKRQMNTIFNKYIKESASMPKAGKLPKTTDSIQSELRLIRKEEK